MNTLDVEALELLNCVRTPVFVIEPDQAGNLVYVAFNKSALDVTGFLYADYVGRTAVQLYAGEYGEYAYKQHLQAYTTGQTQVYELQLPIDGKIRHISTHLKPRLDSTGQVVQLIGTSTEISAERELEDIRRQSRDVTKELEEFIYLAAHDLRSPMRRVRAFADILREDFVDLGDGKLKALDMLEAVSIQAMALLESVLTHAETTGAEISVETFSLGDLCGDILKSLDPAGTTPYAIDGCALYGDRVATQMILQNLIDNAFKHNANVPVSLTVSAKSASTEFFSITVTDNGRGMINPATLFEAQGTDRSRSGFGLLAVRQLIGRRGGRIRAETPLAGTGLSITFDLPGYVVDV